MITNSNAFINLKSEQQKVLDFAVLIDHAIPSLSKTIHGIEKKIPHFGLTKPSYFNQEPKERLKSDLNIYQQNLAKYIVISQFSFFEFYFKELMKELLDFHGGESNFFKICDKYLHEMNAKNSTMNTNISKLNEYPKKSKISKYKKQFSQLQSLSYSPPYLNFSRYGLKHFCSTIASGKFTSSEIPNILENLFFMELSYKVNLYGPLKTKDLKDTFNSMRTLRNNIGHGKIQLISLNKAMAYCNFLRKFAVKVDRYIVNNYFIIQF